VSLQIEWTVNTIDKVVDELSYTLHAAILIKQCFVTMVTLLYIYGLYLSMNSLHLPI